MSHRDPALFWQFGRKIVAIGRNYADHAKELGNAVPSKPFFFLKPTSSYVVYGGHGSEPARVEIPRNCTNLHHEVELGVIIGKSGRHIAAGDAMRHVGGYTLALDMTARELQNEAKKAGLPWSESKGYDTFCPVSGFVEPGRVKDLSALTLALSVDGKERQRGSTSLMMFRVPELIAHVSSVMTLEEGDLILTGTPAGVDSVKHGQNIVATLTDDLSGAELLRLVAIVEATK